MESTFKIELKNKKYSVHLQTERNYGDLEIVRYNIYDDETKGPVSLDAYYDDPEEQVVAFLEWLENKTTKGE